jgi:hypothetical protein
MKLLKATQIMGLIFLAVVMGGSAFAQRHGGHAGGSHFSGRHFSGSHVGVGIYFGGPAFWYYPSPYYYYPSPYYYSPYYYYPPAAAVPYSPPAYVEQGTPTEQFQSNWWYFCAGSNSYYPYVKECPGGWQRITPQPPPPG